MAKMTTEQKKAYGKQKSADMAERWFNTIEDGIRNNNMPWRKPWVGGTKGMPQNLRSKKPYRGGNIMGLWFTALSEGWDDMRFGTRKQLIEAGLSIKGLKTGSGIPIRFFKPNTYEKENDKGETEVRNGYVTRWYEVWCVQQCEDYEAPHESDSHQPVPEHDMMAHFETYAASQPTLKIERVGSTASYRLNGDLIRLPVHDAFTDSLGEVMTAFHEAAHSTGHPQRCDRPLGNSFGNVMYAFEELIAEITCMFTVMRLGGSFEPSKVLEENANSLAYLDHWLKACKDKDKALTAAFGEAQKASDFIVKHSIGDAE